MPLTFNTALCLAHQVYWLMEWIDADVTLIRVHEQFAQAKVLHVHQQQHVFVPRLRFLLLYESIPMDTTSMILPCTNPHTIIISTTITFAFRSHSNLYEPVKQDSQNHSATAQAQALNDSTLPSASTHSTSISCMRHTACHESPGSPASRLRQISLVISIAFATSKQHCDLRIRGRSDFSKPTEW
jgi:hypothetical protein